MDDRGTFPFRVKDKSTGKDAQRHNRTHLDKRKRRKQMSIGLTIVKGKKKFNDEGVELRKTGRTGTRTSLPPKAAKALP